MTEATQLLLLRTAGVAQLVLAVGSLAIPRVLDWRSAVAPLEPGSRAVFWTWAGYILSLNVAFGLLDLLGPGLLLDDTLLARAMLLVISVYWTGRLVVQFLLPRDAKPEGRFFVAAEIGLTVLFLFLGGVHVLVLVA